MKKIMIIAAIALCAFASNAASFKWSAAGVQDITGTAAYSGEATLYAYLSTADESTAVVVNTATMTGGSILAQDTTFSSDEFVVGSTYKFYYTMTDTEGNVFTSGTRASKAQATSTMALSFAATGTWAAVPEPTSGLLMLVGLAGLALRRRRA